MIHKKAIKYSYPILFVIHSLLAMIAFKDYRMRPSEVIFSNVGDGMKNYFTLLGYVKQPVHDGNFFQYNYFNYPYGEYVYTTDNTPLFAICFKWFCNHIYDASAHTLAIYDFFIVLNFILAGLLCFAVLKRIIGNNWLSFCMSVVLPWINLQVVRVWRGHFNLSLSSLLLLAILLTLYWFEQKNNRRKQVAIGGAMVLLLYFSFLIHGYYIAISSIFLCGILFFWGLYNRKKPEGKFTIGASLIIPVATIAVCAATLVATDGFYKIRMPNAGGYDWMEIKIRFWALVSHYDWHTLFFPVQSRHTFVDPENTAYLGNIGLYAMLFLLTCAVGSATYRKKIIAGQRSFFADPVPASIFWSSLVLLSISFGEHYYIGNDDNDGFLVYNFLNPFYLLHKVTIGVEQFRALGRFSWAFFWGFNIWMLHSILGLFPALTKELRYVVVAGIVVLGGAEVKDYVDAMQARAAQPNYLNPKEYVPKLSQLKIDYRAYQAMLSLPYYNVGAEKSDVVLDDVDASTTFSFQMSLYTGLPLMNVKLARTVLAQAEEIERLIGSDSLSQDLNARLNDKPVLVFLYKEALTNNSLSSVPHEDRPVARELYFKTLQLPQRLNLQAIDSMDGFVFYKWYPKQNATIYRSNTNAL